MSTVASRIQSVDDAAYFAQRRLPRFLYQKIEAGSGSGVTVRANVQAFEEVSFRPRAAVSVPQRDIGARVLGFDISMPVIISPAGGLRVGHRDGEVGVARAAGAAGTIEIVSTVTATSIEDITRASTGPIFYQLYYIGGRAGAEATIERAKQSGCKALVVTVDSPVATSVERPYSQRAYSPTATNLKETLRILPQLLSRPGWLWDFVRDGAMTNAPMGRKPNGLPMSVFECLGAIFGESPVWADMPWIREQWGGPLVIKGIVTVEDARPGR